MYRTLLLLALVFSPVGFFAQTPEVCNDGIDNDNDGLVDIFDVGDCNCGTVACGVPFYNICVPACSRPLPPFTVTPVQNWSRGGVFNNYIPLVGDVDGDCVPDVVVRAGNLVQVLNSTNGNIKFSFPLTMWQYCHMALGDVDNDPEAEIFVTALVAGAYRIVRLDYNGGGNNLQLTWSGSTPVANPRYGPSLADFNYDGIAEVYTGNQIWNSQTGLELANGGAANNQGWYPLGGSNFMSSGSIAADVLPDAQCANCTGLELVAGNQTYSVNIVSLVNAALNSMTVEVTGPQGDGVVRLVDFDRDGDLDAVVTRMITATSGARIFIWDVQTPAQMGSTYFPPNGPNNRIGAATIADVDNDSWPEIIVCTSQNLSVLHDWNFAAGNWGLNAATTQMSTLATTDVSGATGVTAYDFNGDGAIEILYRDQTQLRIFDAAFSVLASFGCTSGTATEYPVVADIDADGETEILSVCGGTLRAYNSNNQPWIRARNIWNQWSYFVVNINDNGTVPVQQQNPHIVGDSVLLNNFLVQQAVGDTGATVLVPLPNVQLQFLGFSCNALNTDVDVQICNAGDNTIPAGNSIAFYSADPTAVNAPLIQLGATTANIAPGTCDTITFTLPVLNGPLFGVGNDDASLPRPYNLATQFPATSLQECDYTDNIDSLFFSCTSVTIVLDSTWTNPCNGDMQAAIFVSGTGGTPAYTYSLNGGAFGPSGSFTGLSAGVYQVVIEDQTGNRDTLSVTLLDPPAVTISLDSVRLVNCNGAADGYIEVSGGGGTPGYTYSLDGVNFQPGGIFTGLAPAVYIVRVMDANGCRDSLTVPITEPPVLNLNVLGTGNPTCNGAATGTIVVFAQGGTLGYQYTVDGVNWQPTGTFNGLPAGMYNVIVEDTNGCRDTLPITLTQPPALQVVVDSVRGSLCDNGYLELSGSGGTPGYIFAVGNGAFQAFNIFTGVPSGLIWVHVMDASGCRDSLQINVPVDPPIVINPVVVDIRCNGSTDGSVTINATGGFPGYTYSDDGIAFQAGNFWGGLGPGTTWYYVMDQNGCVDSLQVTVNEPPVLTVNAASMQGVSCNGGTDGSVTLAGAGGTPAYEFSLDGVTYAASGTFSGLAPGTYTGFVRDVNGCVGMVSFTVTEPAPIGLTLNSATPISCFGGSNGIIDLSGSGGTAPYEYSFQGGAFQPSAVFTGLSAGTYQMIIRDANGCTDTLPVTLAEPLELLATVASQSDESCTGFADGQVDISVGGGASPYLLSVDNGPTQSGTTFGNLSAGAHTVNITDGNGCTTSLSVTIGAGTAPIAGFVPDYVPCARPIEVSFTNQSQGAVTYFWTFGDGNDSSATDPIHTYATTGTYDVTLVATDANGCVDTATQQLVFADFPVAAFGSNPALPAIVDVDAEIQFSNQSLNAVSWLWEFGDGSSSGLENPVHAWAEPGEYCVTLWAFSAEGCVDSIVQCPIRVIETNLFVPTAFTPNGDGLNDVFEIVTTAIFDDYQLQVFSRWGELIFQSREVQDFWTGEYHGKMASEGTYVYRIIATTATGRKIDKSGSVMLLR